MVTKTTSLASIFICRPMSRRLNSNHIKPCACFECDKYPNRPRYTEDEWTNTYPGNTTDCKFCGMYAAEHAGSWHSGGETGEEPNAIFAGGSCKMSMLSRHGNNIKSDTWLEHNHSFSSEFFYIPIET